jgi:hypothetical protein
MNSNRGTTVESGFFSSEWDLIEHTLIKNLLFNMISPWSIEDQNKKKKLINEWISW